MLALNIDLTSFGWLSREFRPYSPTHLKALLGFALLTIILVGLGRRYRVPQQRSWFDRTLGVVSLLLWLFANGWELLASPINWYHALPLHVCDLTWLNASAVLLTDRRFYRSLSYFGGLGLSIQGFLTPALADGPASPNFWFFWLSHGAIAGTAIYDIAVHHFRPTWRDCLGSMLAVLPYLAIVLPINIAFGFNYGFVGNAAPTQATLIDVLGPWPERIVAIVLLVWVAMLLMMVPWQLTKRYQQRSL
jgi:hypothetical integral membrane protein (TIGR02206 family)